MQLSDFPHVAGIHCSSSSIADILRYDGQPLSEAMVFGLGSGLGFVQSGDARFSPRYRFNGRALDLEGKFFALFGAPLQWARRWAPEAIAAALREGRPVIAQTDIAYLPYYDRVHFPLHGIVVTGWDGECATVADTFSNELQSVTAAQLRDAARGEGSPFMEDAFRIAPAPRIEARADADAIARSIRVTTREMLQPATSGTGVPAMRELAAARKAWRDSPDWQWSARFGYQGIEKRGTGGGGFRALYAAFLEEALPVMPSLARIRALERMRDSATRWSLMAQALKRAFVQDMPAAIEEAAARLDDIATFETALMEDLAALS
jgi:uncharacterized protein DUF4872/butirosin biosynthesis protein H-like